MKTSWLVVTLLGLSLASLARATENRITFASYNVENLFDAQHDAGKLDWEFLPLAFKKASHEQRDYCKTQSGYNRESCFNLDWSQQVLDAKLSRIADTVMTMNHGQGPDILVLAEVENKNVLHQLNSRFLKNAGYQTEVLLEGWDNRGIDVAVLARFPQAGEPVLHQIEFSPENLQNGKAPATRGILEVPLRLPSGETLTVMGVHFPAQSHPHSWREDAAATVNKIAEGKGPNAMILVGGDFNITRDEENSSNLFHNVFGKDWSVSHLVGCQQCQGTEVYRHTWSFLDAHLYSPSLMAGGQAPYQVDVSSITAFNQGKYQLLRDGTPARFRFGSDVGVSDHLPMYTELIAR
jgi:endonuclease/exonuclease/phosphatase family metal-dependent hydrolase